MTIALYSPYIPKHAGGGERYLLSIAETLASHHDVVLLVDQRNVQQTTASLFHYEKMFGLDLSSVTVKASAIPSGSLVARMQETSSYDVLFAMTDGSFFPSFAKKSYLIIQVPWTRSLRFSERIKLLSWSSIIVYSNFVQRVLSKSWNTNNIRVLAPYVDLNDFMPSTKEQSILSVGRFFSHTQSNSKRQDILIDAFKALVDRYYLKGWKLVLAGNVDPNPDSHKYIEELKASAKGYNVVIHPNISYDELTALTSRASLYWHGAGFEVNEHVHPVNTEHFGITTLEAMACGAIPIVVPKGGQAEIVTDEKMQFASIDELVEKTNYWIHADASHIEETRQSMREQATKYSKTRFAENVRTLVPTI